MPAPIVPIAAFVGFAVVIVAVAVLNDGSPIDFSGLFPPQGRGDWPRGVQEEDVPRFAVDHADARRSADVANRPSIQRLADAGPPLPRIERVVQDVHRLALKP